MKTIKNIIAGIIAFLSSTGLTWFGYAAGAILIFILFTKTWFWGVIFGVLIGLFVMKNLELLKPWALKQLQDLKDKF